MNQQFIQTVKERVKSVDKKTYIVIGLLFIVSIVAWNVFSSGIHNNGSGIEQARSDLRSAKQQKSKAIDGITAVENGLTDS